MTVWTTKDGRTMLMAEMGDTHLHNSIAMLERNLRDISEEYNACASYCARGDGALMAQASAMRGMENRTDHIAELLRQLREERSSREKSRG